MRAIVVFLAFWLAVPALADDEPYLGSPIEEGSTSELGMVFRDAKGTSITPQHIMLWVDDTATTQRLYGPVLVTPGPSLTVELPPQANQIVTGSKAVEEHSITTQFRYPAGCVPVPTPNANCQTKVGQVPYLVKNRRVVVGGAAGTYGPTPAPTPTP